MMMMQRRLCEKIAKEIYLAALHGLGYSSLEPLITTLNHSKNLFGPKSNSDLLLKGLLPGEGLHFLLHLLLLERHALLHHLPLHRHYYLTHLYNMYAG